MPLDKTIKLRDLTAPQAQTLIDEIRGIIGAAASVGKARRTLREGARALDDMADADAEAQITDQDNQARAANEEQKRPIRERRAARAAAIYTED